MLQRRAEPYDAIVVGSGITGGLAAKELCERGLRTLVVERGRHVEHGKDYVTEWLEPWELEYRGRGEPELYARDYPIQSKNYAFGEATKHFFVNDREHPYVSEGGGQDFRWIRGYHLADAVCSGDEAVCGGAISISRPICAMGMASTGRFVTRTSIPGT